MGSLPLSCSTHYASPCLPQRLARLHPQGLALVQERCRARLADFKCVREVLLLDALPRNALGKVQKHRIVPQPGAASRD